MSVKDVIKNSVYEGLGGHCRHYKEKARTIKNNETELIIEVRTREKEELLQQLEEMKFLTQVNCICHDGECRV